MDKIINKFLKAYAKNLDWSKSLTPSEIQRKLCEESYYGPDSRDFHMIALGYFWNQTGSYDEATVELAVFRLEMEDVYKEVAKENKWE